MSEQRPEHREPTGDEILAVVDTIDMLIAACDEPPYDEATLPRTWEELAKYMIENNLPMAGIYPADVPQIPLVPVDDLTEFGVKRFPRESVAYSRSPRPGIAKVIRCKPLPEISINAERFEVFHIAEGTDGLHIHIEGVTRPDNDPERDASNELRGILAGLKLGIERVTAHDCHELVRQLGSSAVMLG